jgi:1-acyl-sn-glycerol-3-phosphate acyltransferase
MKRIPKIIPSILQRLSWLYFLPLFLFFLNLKVEGRKNIRNIKSLENGGKGVIFASYHSSMLDPYIIASSFSLFSKKLPLRFVSLLPSFYKKNDITSFFYSDVWLRLLGAVPAIRGLRDYSEALKEHVLLLNQGASICIFPEGKRSMFGYVQNPKGGVAYLASATSCPVIPVSIVGGEGIDLKDFLLRRRQVTIRFGKPIYLEKIKDQKEYIQKAEIISMAINKGISDILSNNPDTIDYFEDRKLGHVFDENILALYKAYLVNSIQYLSLGIVSIFLALVVFFLVFEAIFRLPQDRLLFGLGIILIIDAIWIVIYFIRKNWDKICTEFWKRYKIYTSTGITLLLVSFLFFLLWRDWQQPFKILTFKSLLPNVFSELIGLVLNTFLFSIFLLWIMEERENKKEIQEFHDLIEDYRKWNQQEASHRIAGVLRRLNKKEVKERVKLQNCFLEGANLKNLTLDDSDFSNANLFDADLTGSRFWKSNFSYADLTGANLNGSNFWKADFNKTKVTAEQLCQITERGLLGVENLDETLRGKILEICPEKRLFE